MPDTPNIDITTNDAPSTPISTLIKTLCISSCEIRKYMCSMLSKTDFIDIDVADICGTGKNKVTKQYLAENVIILTNSIESINKTLHPVLDCDNLSAKLDNICNTNIDMLQSDIKSQLVSSALVTDAVDNAMRKHKIDIETKLSELCDVVKQLSVSDYPIIPPLKTNQNQNYGPKSSAINITAPEPPLADYDEEYLTEEEEKNLMDYFTTIDFTSENGHSVKNFGAKYHYTGAGDVSSDDEIPEQLSPLLDKLKIKYPGVTVTECLINRYEGPDSKLPPHSDDELSIDPESSIHTVSLGQKRTVLFTNKFNNTAESLDVAGRSLYTMTRSSQDYYTHEIQKATDSELRYSITIRHVDQKFRRSTIVLGDSNSKYLLFGKGKGTFGKALPGKRVKAARVEDINPFNCAGYANVVILSGTNNLWPKYVSDKTDIINLADTLKNKVDVIRKFRKDIKIVLLPVLPTRLSGMNRQIHYYNNIVFDRFISSDDYFNISMPSVLEFVDKDYLLNKDFHRNKDNDAVHLNSFGLSMIAQVIKSVLIKGYRRGPDNGRHRGSATRASSGRGS